MPFYNLFSASNQNHLLEVYQMLHFQGFSSPRLPMKTTPGGTSGPTQPGHCCSACRLPARTAPLPHWPLSFLRRASHGPVSSLRMHTPLRNTYSLATREAHIKQETPFPSHHTGTKLKENNAERWQEHGRNKNHGGRGQSGTGLLESHPACSVR